MNIYNFTEYVTKRHLKLCKKRLKELSEIIHKEHCNICDQDLIDEAKTIYRMEMIVLDRMEMYFLEVNQKDISIDCKNKSFTMINETCESIYHKIDYTIKELSP